MRLHSLQVTAFGPFTETVHVDFDQLSEAGLFLLSGATGAGKTSILDAVCFALYGEVPGDRNAAKRLRSDQASPGVAPRVVLEATMGARRFRLTRSPAWARPKKRGRGVTTQQASVVAQERINADWRTLTTRLDEAGHLIVGLLGMNLTQFCQVAMLPQGRFQAFLRARSDDRHQLLQQLFRSQRFADIEAWLAERRRSLRRIAADEHDRVHELTHRLSEVAGREAPEFGEEGGGQINLIRGWATDLLARADTDCHSAATAARESRARLAQATHDHTVILTRSRLQAAYAAAVAERDQLAAGVTAYHDQVAILELDMRARSLAPLVAVAQHSADQSVEAADRLASSVAALGLEMPAEPTFATLPDFAAQQQQHREELTAVRSLAPTADELSRLVGLRDQWTTEVVHLDNALNTVTHRHEHAGRTLARLSRERQEIRDADTRQVRVQQDFENNARLVNAHQDLQSLTRQLAQVAHDLAACRTRTLALKEEWLAIREARLDGMAAEMARELAVGCCCPVCGSADHPHPAQASGYAPDADAEKLARAALDDGEAVLHAFGDRHRELSVRMTLLTEIVGQSTPAGCLGRDSELRSELEGLASICARAEVTDARLDETESALQEHQLERDRLVARRTEVRAGLAQLRPTMRHLQTEIDRVLQRSGATSIDEADAELSAGLARLAQAASAQQAWQSAAALAEQHGQALATAATKAGFATPTQARSALLTARRRAVVESDVAGYDRRHRAAQEILDSAEHRAAVNVEPADPTGSEVALVQAQRQMSEAESRASQADERRDRLRTLCDELATVLTTWAPLLAELTLTARVAALADGSAPDNALQMRLSGYVLAYRLGQVVSAANERLLVMSDQRYRLEHTERRGAGERRGGLSLRVRDDWSGESRDPATLSGGETFVVSLALALGLADVISHEVGGAELDTLFVDEGFGALDADTLDDVMDTLDSLRDGGRVVGVVSHVAEMRHRIPTRLEIAKRRTGSTVALHHGS
ncbi:MAG: AAA family ATPase [Nocardioides sp.]